MRVSLRLLTLLLFLLAQLGAFVPRAGAAALVVDGVAVHLCGAEPGAPLGPTGHDDGGCALCLSCLSGAQLALAAAAPQLPPPRAAHLPSLTAQAALPPAAPAWRATPPPRGPPLA